MRFLFILLIFIGVFYNCNASSQRDVPHTTKDVTVNLSNISTATKHLATGGLVFVFLATAGLLAIFDPALIRNMDNSNLILDSSTSTLVDDTIRNINHLPLNNTRKLGQYYGCSTNGQCNVDANCCSPYKCVWSNGYGSCQLSGHICKSLGHPCQADKDCCYSACNFQYGVCGCVSQGRLLQFC